MSPDRKTLLARIEAFDIDGPDPPALSFATRLARENGWSAGFAARVVREYRRFVFLAVTAGRPVCPSEQVDAAWHLHLTYTKSYWQRLCGETLGRPLHHHPTKGGPAEADRHLRMYADTFAAYREAFGREPPADVWPPADVRFGDDLHHVAVNTRHNWVVPKATAKRAAAVAAAAVLVGVGCGAGGNPFDLKGMAFLTEFLWPLLVVAVALGLVIRWWMKGSAGDDVPAVDWADAAFLAGGKNRLTTAAVARAMQTGTARVDDGGKRLNRAGMMPDDPLGRAVWKGLPIDRKDLTKLRALGTAVERAYAEREKELTDGGLVLASGRRRGVWFLMVLPLLVLALGFGVPRLVAGLERGMPSGYLVMTLVAAFIAFIVLSALSPRRTRRGDAALAGLKAEHGALRRSAAADPGYDAGLAVALFGTAALAGTMYAPLGTWYPRSTGEYSGSGCGTGCGSGGGDGGGGDGGGGGGGCGGCGGGGGD